MIATSAQITSATEPMPQIYKLSLLAPQVAREAKPGQFIMIDCGNKLILRRPISIHNTVSEHEFEILFKVVGKGTSNLSRKKRGDKLDIIGPLGNSFTYREHAEHLIMIAGGMGIAPIFFLLKKAMHSAKKITLLIGATSKKQLLPVNLLPDNIDVVISTEDGSQGKKGMITDFVMDHLADCDSIFACGPLPMYRTLADILRTNRINIPAQASLEVRMGCGFGICYGCSIKTTAGLKQVCTDGPVFDLREIIWEWVKT